MSPDLHRAINRGMQKIAAFQPAIGADGLSGPEREGLEMLTWMSWQHIAALPQEVRDALDALESRGLVERRALGPGGAVSLVRLTVAKQGGEA